MSFRHDCNDRGCYIKTQTPDWRFLLGAFPREIEPTDIDGFVEINGHFLTLEWKGANADLTTGQARAFKPRTATPKDVVIVLYGDALRTRVDAMRVIWKGKLGAKQQANNATVYARCKAWAEWAEKQPAWDAPTLKNTGTPGQ